MSPVWQGRGLALIVCNPSDGSSAAASEEHQAAVQEVRLGERALSPSCRMHFLEWAAAPAPRPGEDEKVGGGIAGPLTRGGYFIRPPPPRPAALPTPSDNARLPMCDRCERDLLPVWSQAGRRDLLIAMFHCICCPLVFSIYPSFQDSRRLARYGEPPILLFPFPSRLLPPLLHPRAVAR